MKKTILFIRDIFWFICNLDENENDEYQVHRFNWAIRFFLMLVLPTLIGAIYILLTKTLSLFNLTVPNINQYFILFYILIFWPYISCFLIFKHFKKWLEKYPVNEKNNFESPGNEIIYFTFMLPLGFLLITSPIVFNKFGKFLDLMISYFN